MKARNAVFAGSWYPSRASECEAAIQGFLKDPSISGQPVKNGVGGIVTHAGWFFSGAIACNVIHALSQSGPVDTVVLFGMHLHGTSPNYLMAEGAWETPFGAVPIDSELARTIEKEFPFRLETAEHFTPDNTIELQLPFIKYFFKDAAIVPMGVPPCSGAPAVGEKTAVLAHRMGRRIRVLGSTDLTHYGDAYGFSPKGRGLKAVEWVKAENDRELIASLLAMDPEGVLRSAESRHNACCAGAAAAAAAASKALGAVRSVCTAYATSHDKSPGDSFVGYVGVVYH